MRLKVLLAVALALLGVPGLNAQDCVFNLSTGYDQETEVVLAEGDPDDDYTFDRGFGPEPALTGGKPQLWPIPPWVANDSESLWISSTASSVDEPGDYTYEIRFFLADTVEAEKLALSGEWTTDNSGTNVIVNGTATGQAIGGFDRFQPIPINFGLGLFVKGENVVQIVVNNAPGVPPAANPVGLRVDAFIQVPGGPQKPVFHRGDADAKGSTNITDGIYVLNYLFLGGPEPPCLEAADADDKGGVNITDGIYILNYLFLGGPAPAAPGPAEESPCGPDPEGSPSDLGCADYPAQNC